MGTKRTAKSWLWVILMCVLGSLTIHQLPPVSAGQERSKLATEYFDRTGVYWRPNMSYERLVLSASGPNKGYFIHEFEAGASPFFNLYDEAGKALPDGQYTYELRAVPVVEPEVRNLLVQARRSGDRSIVDELRRAGKLPQHRLVQSGYFLIKGGALSVPGTLEEAATRDISPSDQVVNDDFIVDGSLCVGNDCYSGYAFGFDTIVLMENNLRILFDDTSSIQNYPRNDWRIILNDSTDGGGNYFAVQDATGVNNIFVIEAGAPNNSLYVNSHGDVGINTSTPYYELHIVDGDSPAVRLEQDGSYGWTPQKWDICGNESNFFIRDATHASKLPFRIEPDAPTDSIFIKRDGKVGIGTGAPGALLELETTGEDAEFLLDRYDGARAVFSAKEEFVSLGTQTSHPLKFFTNGPSDDPSPSMTIDTSGNVLISGNLELASSRDYKENIRPLEGKEAIGALKALRPVRFNYKRDLSEESIGFIAEEVPDLVATSRRNSLNPMYIVAVLAKAVQEQQKIIEKQQTMLEEQQGMISRLAEKMLDLDSRMNSREGKVFFAVNLLDSE